MKEDEALYNNSEMTALCHSVKRLIETRNYLKSTELIQAALSKYPHAPEPHNLYGIQLEHQGNHLLAMKHFRAAWALDPTYIPAKYNMNQYAEMFCQNRMDIYVPEDCPMESKKGEGK